MTPSRDRSQGVLRSSDGIWRSHLGDPRFALAGFGLSDWRSTDTALGAGGGGWSLRAAGWKPDLGWVFTL